MTSKQKSDQPAPRKRRDGPTDRLHTIVFGDDH